MKSDKQILPKHYVKIEQPFYNGNGVHNIIKLESLCHDFTEYCHQQGIIKYALHNEVDKLKETLLNVITAVEKERKLSGKGKQLPIIKEAYSVLKSLK